MLISTAFSNSELPPRDDDAPWASSSLVFGPQSSTFSLNPVTGELEADNVNFTAIESFSYTSVLTNACEAGYECMPYDPVNPSGDGIRCIKPVVP